MVGREQAREIALAGGEPAWELVAALLDEVAKIGGLVEQIDGLSSELAELKRQINRDSSNSSMPPSSDPPKSRAERRQAAREAYKRSFRTSGGQPGHEGKSREIAAPEQLDEVFTNLPDRCGCGHRFDGNEEPIADPLVHQVWELPPIEPLIFEHRLARLACPCCGAAAKADLPAGVGSSAFGPRLQAHIATLAGIHRLSRRQVQDVVGAMFGIEISLGAVDRTIVRMSALLADPWAELREAVRKADAVHADETGWRLGGAGQWLWVAASALHACFRIDPSRSQAAAKELLGEDFGAIAITDRYAGYHFLDILQQQLCWAHVGRQMAEISERGGAAGKLGAKLRAGAAEVFATHRAYLEANHDLAWLKAELSPLRERIEALLEQGTRGRDPRTARFCTGLLGEYEALWTFCEVPDVDPTNNAAERAVRHGVLLRKTQLGTRSNRGSRWIERICSVRETCRLQERSVLAFMIETAEAAHGGGPPPSLVPT